MPLFVAGYMGGRRYRASLVTCLRSLVLYPCRRLGACYLLYQAASSVLGGGLAAVCFLVFTKLQAYYLLIWTLGALTYVVAPKHFNKWVFGLTLMLLPVLIMVLQLTSGGHVTSSLVQMLPTQNRQSLEIIFSLNFCLFLQQVLLIQPRNKASLALNHWGTKLAAFSYTLYLVHVLVMRLLQNYGAERAVHLTPQSVALYFAYTFIGMLVCYGVYWCFERHTYAVKCWIKKRI